MKKLLYLSSLALVMAGSAMMSSCSDFLESEDKSSGDVNVDEFFSKDPSTLLNSAYLNLKDIANQYAIHDQGSDLYVYTRGMALSSFMQFTMTADDADIQQLYVKCYSVIRCANGVLKYAEADSAEAAQARFLRAYAYYMLTQQFGGVPYIDRFVQDANRNYPRAELSTEYQDIIADLTDLYDDSKLADVDHKSGMPSRQAVAALLSKFYLAAGWDIDTELKSAEAGTYDVKATTNFANAFSWAEKAIGGQALTMSFEDKWLCRNEGNDETIWSIKYQKDGISGTMDKECNNQQNSYGGYYGALKGCDSRNQQSVKSLYLFEQGDLRYEGTFMTTFYAGTDMASGYMSYYTKSAEELSKAPIALKFFPAYMSESEARSWLISHQSQMQGTSKAALVSYPNVTTFTFNDNGSIKSSSTMNLTSFYTGTENGVCVKKFDDPVVVNYCFRDIVILHVSEMYLTAAEAALMAGDKANYWKYINAVRSRAGLTTALSSIADYKPAYSTTSSFGALTELDLLLDERARETYAEKTRFVDLRRTKQLVRYNLEFCKDIIPSVDRMKGVDGQIKWLRPIPNGAIENNTGISKSDQNPGYIEVN